jgi:hypothetical protein
MLKKKPRLLPDGALSLLNYSRLEEIVKAVPHEVPRGEQQAAHFVGLPYEAQHI